MGLLDNQGTPPSTSGSNWNEFQMLIMHQLKTHEEGMRKVEGELNKMSIDIAVLKYKAGVWGLLAGVIPAVGILVWEYVKNGG